MVTVKEMVKERFFPDEEVLNEGSLMWRLE